MENVPGFRTKYDGAIFDDFLSYVSKELPAYTLKWAILDAQNYSVPQSRKRLFVCGFLKQMAFDFPDNDYQYCRPGKKSVYVKEALFDLPKIADNWRLDKGFYSDAALTPYQLMMRNGQETVSNNICRISNPEAKVLFDYLKPGQRYTDLSEEEKKKITLFDSFDSTVIQGRCHRLPIDDVSWTIIAHIGMDGYEYIHPTERRTLSVREAARLQSFTDDFVFVGNMREQYMQIGNAVPPLLSNAVAKVLRDSILRSI
jgi:DNA (cytosine-5)-methyltransferase 1